MTVQDTPNGALVDVSDMNLDDLAELGDTVLTAALRRVITEAVDPQGVPYAAFDSSMA